MREDSESPRAPAANRRAGCNPAPHQLIVYRVSGDPYAALEALIGAPPKIGRGVNGKPYLVERPEIKFNISKTKGKALLAIALDVEVGVDIELIRPLPEMAQIAERFLPPGDAEALAECADREREFFRLWTRAEALWKAAGLGLYAAGRVLDGEWMVQEIDAGEGYAAAVAAARPGFDIHITDFGGNE